MKHLALSLLLATAAHADTEAPGPYTVKRDLPGCQSVADLDRIMLMALERRTLWSAPAPRVPSPSSRKDRPFRPRQGAAATIISKGTVVTVQKRTGVYDCVRYKGQPPAYYERTCIYTKGVTTAPLSGPAQTADWYWFY